MTQIAKIPPARIPELILRPFGNDGQYVAKNRVTGTYLKFGEPEYFLLLQLDGLQSGDAIRKAYEERFQEELSDEDLSEFVGLVQGRGLLQSADPKSQVNADGSDAATQPAPKAKKKQSILFFRYSFFDPDRLFNYLEPKLRFMWTRTFMVVSACCIIAAALTVWVNRHDLVSSFGQTFRWETMVVVWITMVLATLCHEFAHGLTCKRHGGEVHEVGFLVMFFMPCFYCNVSDAWLIPEKSKRLWVTLAGAYCDLCIWALACFVWRLTIQDSLVNYVSWVVLSICGARVFFNFNPLMKLDGYYLLSDWLEIPNLRRRGREYWISVLRWVLWGASRPTGIERARALAIYGGISWTFSVLFLDMTYVGLCKWLGARWGWIGIGLATVLFVVVLRKLFYGFFNGEVKKMLKMRHKRTTAWIAGSVAVLSMLFIGRMQDRAGGTFQVRPGTRCELRAPVAGFLREVYVDEGNRVSAGTLVARIEVPDLDTQIAQKQAQLRESQANLQRLEAGARPEEVAELRLKVQRAEAWRNMGTQDLARAKESFDEELSRLDQQISQFKTELDFSTQAVAQAETLYQKGAMAGQQLRTEKKKLQVAESQWQQAQAQKRGRVAAGTLTYEAELARREKELADIQAALALMEAGNRPEDIEAERARGARLTEEFNYLDGLRGKLLVNTPVTGTVITPRMTEKVGQYFEKGALICMVEDNSKVEAEIALNEQDLSGVEAGQEVELKARALPFRRFKARVERIAPAATTAEGDVQSKVVIYCEVEDPDVELRSGMTGFGRIYRGSQPLGLIVSHNALRYLRTEFWW